MSDKESELAKVRGQLDGIDREIAALVDEIRRMRDRKDDLVRQRDETMKGLIDLLA